MGVSCETEMTDCMPLIRKTGLKLNNYRTKISEVFPYHFAQGLHGDVNQCNSFSWCLRDH